MQYNPAVTDRSADYTMMAAQTQANMMSDLGQNIGGALASIGNIYGEFEGRKAKGRAFKKTLEVLGPSIGMTTDKLKATFGDLKNDMDYFNASEMLMPVLPSMINATLGGARIEQSSNMPFVNAGIKNRQNIASGNVPHGSMGVPQSPSGMAPVEPPLPVGDENLPQLQTTVPSYSVPGGDESMRLYNEWKRSRGY